MVQEKNIYIKNTSIIFRRSSSRCRCSLGTSPPDELDDHGLPQAQDTIVRDVAADHGHACNPAIGHRSCSTALRSLHR